jgi:hypothetical protein
LLAVSTQAPPHTDWPVGHRHAPAAQLWPLRHAVGQEPQCATSVSRFVSHPLPATPSQLPKPLLQTSPHVDEEHTAEAFGRAGHTVPQAPQFAVLDVVSTQVPLHSVGAAPAQLDAHAPPEQYCPAAQACPQPPQ